MPEQNTAELKEKTTAILQSHLDKLVQAAKKNEYLVTTNADLSVAQLMAIEEEQRILEGTIGWIINLEKRINNPKIIPSANNLIVT